MSAGARRTAALMVERVLGGGYSGLVARGELARVADPADRRFAAALFYGALERAVTVEAILAPRLRQGARTDPRVRAILMIGVCQLLFMGGVPTPAAVYETVELARAMGRPGAVGFLNAVLRGILRDWRGLESFAAKFPEPQRTSILCSAPVWLVEKVKGQHGQRGVDFLLQSLGPRPTYLRVNPLRITDEALIETLAREGITTLPTDLPHCLRCESIPQVNALESYKKGLFHLQNKASQYAAEAVGAQAGQRVIDVCAAPGGKSFTIAQGMGDTGAVDSRDSDPARAGLIAEGAARLGLRCVTATVADAAAMRHSPGDADAVLCDLPCSGFGVIAAKPEIRLKKPEDIRGLPKLQAAILESACKLVRPGGAMVISTCTILREENGDLLAAFLEDHPEFALCERAHPALHANPVQLLEPGLDGFFIAKLRRA